MYEKLVRVRYAKTAAFPFAPSSSIARGAGGARREERRNLNFPFVSSVARAESEVETQTLPFDFGPAGLRSGTRSGGEQHFKLDQIPARVATCADPALVR